MSLYFADRRPRSAALLSAELSSHTPNKSLSCLHSPGLLGSDASTLSAFQR